MNEDNPDYTTKLSNNTNPSPQNTDYEVLIDASLKHPKVKAMIQQLNELADETRELKQRCEEVKNLKTQFDMTKVFDTKTISKEFDYITNRYYKQGYEDAVNKACEWLERALPLRPDDRDEFIEQFKQAMEGD